MDDCFLTQHVLGGTRDGNTLDLVLSLEPHRVQEVEIGEHLGDSDHNMIRFLLN